MAAKFAVTGDQFVVIDDRMREIKRQLRLKGRSPLDPEQVAAALQRIVEGRFDILPAAEPATTDHPTPITYHVTVDYGQTLEQMIVAGRYDTRNNDIIQQNFPLAGTGQVEVELHLVHLGRNASTDEILAELDLRNLRPATIEELLAFGAKYSELQNEFPITALGSVWRHSDGNRIVAYLGSWRGGRDLKLRWIGCDWDDDRRFLAVSK